MKLGHFSVIPLVFCIISLAGCAVLNKPVQFVDRFIGRTLFPPYSGPKASIVVADFEIKAAKATTETGVGLRDMLIAGLNNTNRFSVISLRNDNIEKNAGLIIAVEVTDFEPRASGGSLGIGGGGSASSGTLGSLLGFSANKSSLALNIRIVDAVSTKVLFSERIIGQAVDTVQPRSAREHKGSALNEGLSAYTNTSMGEAINKCIIEAIEYIVEKVPQGYYKGDKNGKT